MVAMDLLVGARSLSFGGAGRGQRDTGMTNQISQSGQAEVDTFSCNPLGLSVQWLVLSVFIKGDHGDQLRSCPSTRDRMERGGWLSAPSVTRHGYV
jgi:hypothetical protein